MMMVMVIRYVYNTGAVVSLTTVLDTTLSLKDGCVCSCGRRALSTAEYSNA